MRRSFSGIHERHARQILQRIRDGFGFFSQIGIHECSDVRQLFLHRGAYDQHVLAEPKLDVRHAASFCP